jgi:hypothetical protein
MNMDFFNASLLLAQNGPPQAEPRWTVLFVPMLFIGACLLILRSTTRWYGLAAVAILLLVTMLFYVRLAAPVVVYQPPQQWSYSAPNQPAIREPEFPQQESGPQFQHAPQIKQPVAERSASPREAAQGATLQQLPLPKNALAVREVIRAPDPENVPIVVPLAEAPFDGRPAAAPSAAIAASGPQPNVRNPNRNSSKAPKPPKTVSKSIPNRGSTMRPAWVNSGGGRQANGDYYLVVQSTGPTLDFCWQDVYNYRLRSAIQTYIHSEMNGHAWWLTNVPPDLAQMVIVDQYAEPQSAFGSATLFLKIAFSPAAQQRLEQMRAESLISWRITFTAVAGGLLVGFVGIVFGYLKCDALTLGRHRVKLQVLSGVLLCGLITCAVVAFAIFVDTEHWHNGMNMF